MRPSSAELLAAIEVALATRVMPAVDDPVVQSELRSMIAVVRHLQVRVQAEPAVLVSEADDLTALLRAGGHAVDDPPSLAGSDVPALVAHVEQLRAVLDDEIAAADAATDRARLAAIDDYLRRSADRVRPQLAEPFSRGWS